MSEGRSWFTFTEILINISLSFFRLRIIFTNYSLNVNVLFFVCNSTNNRNKKAYQI